MREVLELLEAAPGPSPWYLDAPSACLTSSHGSLRWTFESGAVGAIGGGVSVLRSADGQPLALLGYNCFVKHLAGHRFLVWYQADAASLGDLGCQWATRVARDPADGSIVGEGFRLGVFRLDETDRRIERWLIQDPFFRRAGPLCP